MASWMLPLLPALFISLLLTVPSHCTEDLTSTTLAINQATSTVCGITAGSQHHTIQCTKFPEPANSTASLPLDPIISFDAISGGPDFICGLRLGDSAFFSWDGIGQRIKPVYHVPTVFSRLSVRASHMGAINGDQKKIQWWGYGGIRHAEGCSYFPNSVSGEYHSLTSGDDFSCALNGTGSVQCWGPGAMPIETSFSGMSMSSLAAGGGRICGLNKTGHVTCTGDRSLVPSGDAFEFRSLAIGSNHTCAISGKNGSVVCWGQNSSYIPKGSTRFEFIVARGDLTCGLTTDAFNASCWGLNGTNSSGVILQSLPRILPSACMPNDTICSCGVYPDSGDLCGGSGIICKKYGTATTDSCQVSPPLHDPVKKNKLDELLHRWWSSVIAVVVICSAMFCVTSVICCGLCPCGNQNNAHVHGEEKRRAQCNVPGKISKGFKDILACLCDCFVFSVEFICNNLGICLQICSY